MTVGHAEGFFGAFGNIYADLADAIRARKAGRAITPSYPTAVDGLRSVATIAAAAESAKREGAWVNAVPPLLAG